MQTLLSHIAHLQTGLNARPSETGDVRFLQITHFSGGALLNQEHNSFLQSHELNPSHLLQPNDILFAAKGNNNFAVLPTTTPAPMVASPSFIVLRVFIPHQILPQYLALFLNLPTTQQVIKTFSKGSSIPSISIKALGDLPVQIPPILMQEKLLAFSRLSAIELTINQQLLTLRSQFNNKIIQKAIYA